MTGTHDDSDAASSSAADADVNVTVNDNDGGCSGNGASKPAGLDPVTSDNLIAMLIAQAQQDLALNLATARNLVANQGAALTLGVQQLHAATTVQMFKMSPAEAQALGLLRPPPSVGS